ncbi:MAG: 50S ribosomal protein L11 methyltransferase [Anaerolineae bacterium]
MKDTNRTPRLRWLEARVQADGEAVEAISEYFNRMSTGGAVLERVEPAAPPHSPAAGIYWVIGYFPIHNPLEEEECRRRIETAVWHINQVHPTGPLQFKLLEDEDWAEAWKAHYRPLKLGERLVIKPSWCSWQPQPGEIVVELDPGMAFGTGLHPSTQLCLQALERYCRPGQKVLDLGCGSGILSIAAGKLGAERVLALDIDALAVEVAADNAAANGLADRILVLLGTLPPRGEEDQRAVDEAVLMAPQGFDLMLVNILAEVIATMLSHGLDAWLAQDGHMILSGIIQEREKLVREALEEAGLTVVERQTQGDWVGLVARKTGG